MRFLAIFEKIYSEIFATPHIVFGKKTSKRLVSPAVALRLHSRKVACLNRADYTLIFFFIYQHFDKFIFLFC